MQKSSTRKISIYLRIDSNSINNYFNPHDPARLDRRQLGQEFKDYLETSVADAGRHTKINFKVFCCETGSMRFMVEPLVKTIRRHFQVQKKHKEIEFRKFKRKNYILLFISIAIVIFCQGALPIIFGAHYRIHSMFSNAIDVFSWVILWKPGGQVMQSGTLDIKNAGTYSIYLKRFFAAGAYILVMQNETNNLKKMIIKK